jgi:hypothetical protein
MRASLFVTVPVNRFALSGLIARRAQAELPSALRSDTPPQPLMVAPSGSDWKVGEYR